MSLINIFIPKTLSSGFARALLYCKISNCSIQASQLQTCHQLAPSTKQSISCLKEDNIPDEIPFTVVKLPQILPPKSKVRKYVLCISYCGKDYYGMTRLSGKSIEGDLLYALFKANLISREEYDAPRTIAFQRASRTDKGVSAVRQIVSLNLPEGSDFRMVQMVNQYLPPAIRLMGVKRVGPNFCSHKDCSFRRYSYLFPTYALASFDELTSEKFRASQEHIDRFNEVLSRYIGCHNFFNFTAEREADDSSCYRTINSMDCGQPFFSPAGIEFALVRIKGESFMLHQIRKMLALAFSLTRGLITPRVFEKAWQSHRFDILLAPGLGLILEEPCYARYNWKVEGSGSHEPILWDDCQDSINSFRSSQIYSTIMETEAKEKSMLHWLSDLTIWSFHFNDPDLRDPHQSELYLTLHNLKQFRLKDS